MGGRVLVGEKFSLWWGLFWKQGEEPLERRSPPHPPHPEAFLETGGDVCTGSDTWGLGVPGELQPPVPEPPLYHGGPQMLGAQLGALESFCKLGVATLCRRLRPGGPLHAPSPHGGGIVV